MPSAHRSSHGARRQRSNGALAPLAVLLLLLPATATIARAQSSAASASAFHSTRSGRDAEAARAQPGALSLDEAIELARRNNPDYRAQSNDPAEADWAVRAAWGALLPSAQVSTGMQYQGSGPARFGTFTGEDFGLATTPSYYLSDYSLGVSYRIDAGALARVREARAGRRAAEARVDAAAHDLAHAVTSQYLAAVRARDIVALRRRELARAEQTLNLTRARVEVGAAIRLDARQAEVERGRAEVALLQAENQRETELLRLFERLGVEPADDVTLTTDFEVFEPQWNESALLERAAADHPRLQALRASEAAGRAAVASAKGQYLPSLQVSAGWSGYTREVGDASHLLQRAEERARQQIQNCQFLNLLSDRLTRPLPDTPADCSAYELTPSDEERIAHGNQVFPFDFTPQPFSLRVQLSFPIFQGFTRQRQVESARVRAEDAREQRRAEGLRLRTEIVSLYRTLRTQHRTVELEAENREIARDQLRLARERYEVGAARFIDLSEAETIMARADQAYLNAVHDFHGTLAALAAAVGRDLRPADPDDT